MLKRGHKHTLCESDTSSEDEDSSSSSARRPNKQSRLSIDLKSKDLSDNEDGGGGWDVINAKEQTDETGGVANTNTNYSVFAQRMMKNMGYEEGKGLGKYGQGLVDPVEASRQRGRRGLGLRLEGLEASTNLNWDGKQESIFDQLDGRELQRARSRSNPFETLGKLFFQNRAALKMANMDCVFDFMFTRPKNEAGETLIGPEDLLYFADVCAAPGGFSEYVLWRRKTDSGGFCDAKGFGFTLRENDFKLHDFFAAPAEFFEPHYGINGQEGDGDVFKPSNITNFVKFVRTTTKGKGVHFMMADGGFSVEGQENIQEILSKQLYLCQCIVALGIVRTDGHFVCKLFDVFTTFSVGLVYLMYRCFKYVCLHKPNTSRPANSERYIICKWKRDDVDNVYRYLFEMNERLIGLSSSMDVTELVPLEHLRAEKEFFDYICTSNDEIYVTSP
ncbi:hypothetical protein OTU49_005807 [Cherax quadricarinatus]|uniref:Cap-specific mRNA (nucleoside-2'-O-)-methyltransferase 1 n=1 Tax=Cherax quadricarinatus TaxID=27406 RepID=A0AAW0X476_CHEQU